MQYLLFGILACFISVAATTFYLVRHFRFKEAIFKDVLQEVISDEFQSLYEKHLVARYDWDFIKQFSVLVDAVEEGTCGFIQVQLPSPSRNVVMLPMSFDTLKKCKVQSGAVITVEQYSQLYEAEVKESPNSEVIPESMLKFVHTISPSDFKV